MDFADVLEEINNHIINKGDDNRSIKCSIGVWPCECRHYSIGVVSSLALITIFLAAFLRETSMELEEDKGSQSIQFTAKMPLRLIAVDFLHNAGMTFVQRLIFILS